MWKRLLVLLMVSCTLVLGCATKKSVIAPPSSNLDAQLDDLTTQITNSLTETKKSKIAVIEFSDLDGNVTELGKYLSEELITRLFRTKKFEVVERQLLNKVLTEHQLSLTGVVDPNSAKELGKILGVDSIASGTIADLVSSIKINARLIATETGSIFAVAAVEVFKDGMVKKLLGEAIKKDKVVKRLPEKPTKGGKKKGEDNFDNGLSKWIIIDPAIEIDDTFGSPSPSAKFPNAGIILAKESYITDGIIEADVYLADNSRIDILFRIDSNNTEGYTYSVATYQNGFDYKAAGGRCGKGVGGVTPNVWHHVKVMFDGDNFEGYIDGMLKDRASVSSFSWFGQGRYYEGYVGLENWGQSYPPGYRATGDVWIDNFEFRRLQSKK